MTSKKRVFRIPLPTPLPDDEPVEDTILEAISEYREAMFPYLVSTHMPDVHRAEPDEDSFEWTAAEEADGQTGHYLVTFRFDWNAVYGCRDMDVHDWTDGHVDAIIENNEVVIELELYEPEPRYPADEF